MTGNRLLRQGIALILVINTGAFLSGCATPSEIKRASRKQLELIGALDDATRTLQQGLNSFHREKEARIRQEGTVLIARQAIDAALKKEPPLYTADEVFKTYKKEIQPWVDYAFTQVEIDAEIQRLEGKITKVKDVTLKGALQNDLDDLRLRKATLSQKPPTVREIEAVIQDDITQEKETQKQVNKRLQLLRAQIALMETMATRVDDWLTIDVTITQQQADALKEAFTKAATALGGQ